MTRAETIDWLARCIDLCAHGAPMTEIERADHRLRVAAEYHRAMTHREHAPQLELQA